MRRIIVFVSILTILLGCAGPMYHVKIDSISGLDSGTKKRYILLPVVKDITPNAYKKYNLEFKTIVGWGILWRTSLVLGIIGGISLLIPQLHQLDIIARGLLPFILSIPILGFVANYFLRKHSLKIHIAEEKNANQPIYNKQIYRLAIISFVFSIIWLGGVGSLIAIISGRKALNLKKKYETKVIGGFAAKFGYIAGWIGLCLWGGMFLLTILMAIMRG